MNDSTATPSTATSSSAIQCTPVRSWFDRRAFLKLERELYAGDPNWVTPLWSERKQLCGFGSHPFYKDAESQAFLARKDGRVVGRVVAITTNSGDSLVSLNASMTSRSVAVCLTPRPIGCASRG